MNRLIFLLPGLLLAAAASAQQYKWVDPDGKTRYGDVPPPGVKAQRMKPPAAGAPAPAPSSPAAAAKDGKKDEKPLTPEQAFQKRQKEQREAEEKAAKNDATAEQKRANCEAARAQLRNAETGQRIARTDSKGERYFLDEAQTQQEAVRARGAVQQWCN